MESREIKIKPPADVPLLTAAGDHRSEAVFHTLEQTLFWHGQYTGNATYSQRTAEYKWPVCCYHHTRMHLLLAQSTYFFVSLICGMGKTGLRLWCNLELRSSPGESSGHHCTIPCPNHITYPGTLTRSHHILDLDQVKVKTAMPKDSSLPFFGNGAKILFFLRLRSAVGNKICNTAVIQW